MAYTRFHVMVGRGTRRRRTTVSIETYLAEAMAIKLGQELGTPEAHSAVRAWLQEQQDNEGTKLQTYLIKRALVLEVMDKRISKVWWGAR